MNLKGQEVFAPRPQGLRGLIIEDINILTPRNALKCILSRFKGRNRKLFSYLRSQGGLISQFCPWASKSSRLP